jgi:hypothetical protein
VADASQRTRVPFSVTRVSPSRVGKYAECGLAFKFHYIDEVPLDRKGSAALFGSVAHKAREWWILDREQDLIPLMEKAWLEETNDEPVIRAFLQEYQAISRRACRLEEEIRRRRPELKAVRMSKDWKTSDVAAETNRMLGRWWTRLNEESRYEFSERDPLPALYDESLVLAWKYSDRWRHLPNALHSEFAFEFEWNGFTLNGKIDEIGRYLNADGEMLGYTVEDAKTYRRDWHQFRDSRQLAIYDLAIREYASKGILDLDLEKYPVFPVVDLMRLGKKLKFDPVTEAEHRRLLAELRMYQRGVEGEIFLPAAKSCNADFCDYAKVCAFHHGNQGHAEEWVA